LSWQAQTEFFLSLYRKSMDLHPGERS